jgi:hypothetical protein
MPSIWGASDSDVERYGMAPGTKAKGVFAYADRRKVPDGGYPDGETSDGIPIDRHPDAMLRDEPDLWRIVALWRSPIPRELSFELLCSMTHFDVEAWSTMLGAHYRAIESKRGK